jgi:MFS family permease
MSSRRFLFVCSCIALVTSAFTFIVRGAVLQDMGDAFGLTQEQKGGVEGAVFLGMALSMLLGGFICDALGMKRILILAFISHLGGSLGTIFAPHNSTSYYWLYGSSLLMGFGNGFTEVGINPLIATLYSDKKTHYLNILHAWWPGGLVIGGLSAVALHKFIPNGIAGLALWQASLMLIALPAFAYGVMLLPSKFPATERVASGVSTGDMFKECFRPMFLLWGLCMFLTAATELGPQKWQASVMESIAKFDGTLVLVYTSGMMFVLRHFAGPIAHKISPTGMMLVSSILAGVGLYLLSFADSGVTAIAYATVFGLGIAFFWPTMLGVTAERFPKGGALALALMGSIGNLSISQVLPQMGRIVDTYAVQYVEKNADSAAQKEMLKFENDKPIALKPDAIKLMDPKDKLIGEDAQSEGYRMAFRWVSLLPTVLVVLFGGIILYDRSRGGYKPEILISREEEDELFAGGVQGAVE